jgi:hypothetical protein
MRCVWIDEGSQPDFTKITNYGIQGLYFSTREQYVTPTYLDSIRDKGYVVGIYRAWNWDAGLSGAKWADLLSAEVTRVGGNGKQLDVQANIELKDTLWIKDFLIRWRQHRQLRPTSWTMEGHQGGWMVGIKYWIEQSKVVLVPQCYDGAMNPWDSAAMVKDLKEDYKFSNPVIPFHGAKALRPWADGFIFTQNNLP